MIASYYHKEPEFFDEQECIDSLKDASYNSAKKARVAERLAELQNKRREAPVSPGIHIEVHPRKATVGDVLADPRKVRYATRNTWHDWKTKVCAGVATAATIYDWLEDHGFQWSSLPLNSAIFWTILLTSLAVVAGVWLIHLFEERDLVITRKR